VNHTVSKYFSSAASGYEYHSVLQEKAAAWLADATDPRDAYVLDLGCGTGLLGGLLRKRAPVASLLGTDLSAGMLKEAQKKQYYDAMVRADLHQLPFQRQSFDLMCANMSLQWLSDPDNAFLGFKSILKPGGRFVFTVPLPGSLKEIEQSWADTGDTSSHINSFLSSEEWRQKAKKAGFEVSIEQQPFIRWFEHPRDALMSLKQVGANKVMEGGAPGLTGVGRYRKMLANYEKRRQKQGIPLTYELMRAKLVSI